MEQVVDTALAGWNDISVCCGKIEPDDYALHRTHFMNRDQWPGDAHALFNSLKQLLEDRFGALSEETVEEVFSAVLEDCVEGDAAGTPEAGSEVSSGWTGRIDSGVVRPLRPDTVSMTTEGGGPAATSVKITAEAPVRVHGLLHQILEVGAVMVRLEEAPELNDLVDISLEFPTAHLTVDMQGRVVHNSRRGTAIEVSGLGREDRVALQAMRDEGPSTVVGGEGATGAQVASEPDSPREKRPPAGAADSVQEPGAVPPVQEHDDPRRSFASLGSSRGGGGRRRQGRRVVQSTLRRQVDLTDPDMHVATSTKRIEKQRGKTTREFYGPPPPWLEPTGDADRIEELREERVLDILLQLSENGFTGILLLEIEEEDVEQLVFDGGCVVDRAVRPRVTEEELGPMLLAADRITRRQLAMAAAHADEVGLTVARSLMDLGILNPDELRHAIAGRLTFLLREFCDRSDGAVRIYDSQSLPAGFLPQPPLRVHVAAERVIYDRLYRRLSQKSGPAREKQMEEFLDTYPEVIEHQRDRLRRAVSEEEQRRFIDQGVNGDSRMREVMTESPLGPSDTFAALFSLHRMGLVRFDRSLHDTVVRERLRENVTVKYLSVHKASYFEVLNVHWSSYSEVIEEAYQNLSEQFDPESMPDDLEEEIHNKVAEIDERIEAAYAALAKRKTRHAYRTRIMPEYKLDHAIPLFLKQCELAERRQHWTDARDAIRRVLEIEPEHADARRKLERFEDKLDGSSASDTQNPLN